MASVSDTAISKAELQRLIDGKHERVTFTEATATEATIQIISESHEIQYKPNIGQIWYVNCACAVK